MKLSVILAALAGLTIAAWFVVQVGFAAVLARLRRSAGQALRSFAPMPW